MTRTLRFGKLYSGRLPMTSGKSAQIIQEKRLKTKALIALILLVRDTLTIAKTNFLDGSMLYQNAVMG